MSTPRPSKQVKPLLDLARKGGLLVSWRAGKWVISAPKPGFKPVFIRAGSEHDRTLENRRVQIRHLIAAVTGTTPADEPEPAEAEPAPAEAETTTDETDQEPNTMPTPLTAAEQLVTHAQIVWEMALDDATTQGGVTDDGRAVIWRGSRETLIHNLGAEWTPTYRRQVARVLDLTGAMDCIRRGQVPTWAVRKVWPEQDAARHAFAIASRAVDSNRTTSAAPAPAVEQPAAPAVTVERVEPVEVVEPDAVEVVEPAQGDGLDPITALTRIQRRIEAAEARADEAERRAADEAIRADEAERRAADAEARAEKAEQRVAELEQENADLTARLDEVKPKLKELETIRGMFRTLAGS